MPRNRQRGLATVLVLLAIVAFVTAFMLYNSLGSVSQRLTAVGANATSFKKIDDALTRFVMLNQRLPCPASGTAHTGDADPNNAVTTCNSPSGVVPWSTLGLSQTDAVDPWGRYIAYRVYDGASGFTRTNGMSLADCLDETASTIYSLSGTGSSCNSNTHENTVSDFFATKGLTVNDMGTARAQVGYVLVSTGETGAGGYYPGGSATLTAPSASSKEFLNAGSAGTYWITAPSATGVSAEDASHFDDVLSYAFASDVAKKAQLAGRPWKLSQVFTQSTAGLTAGNYNTGSASIKIQPSSAGVNQGPVTVAAGGDAARVVCITNMTPQGAAPCLSAVNNGSDDLDTSNNEYLTFDFRVTRKKLVVALTDFRFTGGGSNREQAQVTFYDAAGVQVGVSQTVQACSSGGNQVAQFTVTPTGDFTKVKISALTITGSGGPSDFGVAAILACKITSDCPIGTAPAGIAWPAIDCFG
jgi:hypothetical protein